MRPGLTSGRCPVDGGRQANDAMAAELFIGDPAPSFDAMAVGEGYPPEGGRVSLESLRRRRVVLYFYPEDDTPGCTEQACAIRDAWEEFRRHAALFGVNNGGVAEHRRFIEKFALPFPLLTDSDDTIAKAYGLWLGEGGGGDAEGGAATERSTFIIDAEGRVERILRRVKPAEHAGFLLDILRGTSDPAAVG